ncbi:MAG: hypothetical protein ACOZQL_14955 [Myxococcota bacterium]
MRALLRLVEPLQLGRVLELEPLGEHWQRVLIEPARTPPPRRAAPTLEVVVARGLTRRYTPARLDGDALEVVVFLHGAGPGTRWVKELSPGSRVAYRWLESGLELADRPGEHVLCGDESCLGLTHRLARGAGGARHFIAALESALPLPPGVATWLPRTRHRAEAQWRWLARQSRRASFYLAGHGPSVRRLARQLADSGVPRARILTSTHWAEGRPGL